MVPASPEPRECHWNSTEMDDIFVHISDGHSFIIPLKGTPSQCNFFILHKLFSQENTPCGLYFIHILFYLFFLITKFTSPLFYWTTKSLRWQNFLSGIYFQLLLNYKNIKKKSTKTLKYSVKLKTRICPCMFFSILPVLSHSSWNSIFLAISYLSAFLSQCSIPVKRHHKQGNFYKRKHVIEDLSIVSGFVVIITGGGVWR